ncbi:MULTISPECIES: family 1 glycosylhydrolase [unclassified Rhodococcus (in: high G+C Gram-positive bacteria)]|uniref:glycoside hydrolase family 1 protein n=1 Tax=unclassified Rhodococcus (in: high G+C Gram-positive bacteria) TaxID=192944 RepID=UPI0014475266|nr:MULTISPECIES: family 1 glycosylhydrolase [unclassified Rhodococcus (in: high G+C Gram-positive bacteria)]
MRVSIRLFTATALIMAWLLVPGAWLSTTLSPSATATPPPLSVGEDFLWGVSTAGFQAEGSSPDSNWSRYSASENVDDKVGTSVDFRHRYPEDIENASKLGVSVFRFSVEWARVQPVSGTWDEEELAYYDDVIAQIRAHGMRPMITLDHWVYPGWVADQGGWTNPKTVDDWLANASHVIDRYAGNDAQWITINEPTAYIIKELTFGGITLTQAPQMMDRLVQVHRAAFDMIHTKDPGAPVSSNLSFIPTVAGLFDSTFVDRVRDKMDFLGLDYYYGLSVDNITAAYALFDQLYKIRTQPEGLYHALMYYRDKFPDLPIYIVENGMPTDNAQPRKDGYTRSDHLSDHIYWLERARQDGANVIGYNYWSITDNYEWGSYRSRFGLFTVDVQTDPSLARQPTDAVETYRRIITDKGVPANYTPVRRPGFCSLVTLPESCLEPPSVPR